MAAVPERTGVVRDEVTGDLLLPATQRPDGSWRKPRRVKDGYVPQEEVPVYESKGMQFVKSKPDHPVGLSSSDIEKLRQARRNNQGETEETMSKAAKKNAKRKEKKKQQISNASNNSVDSVASGVSKINIIQESVPSHTNPTQEEIEKKIKNLKKKLRQIEDLEAKIESGQLQNPEKEQLEKIKKKHSILDEIEELELDLDD